MCWQIVIKQIARKDRIIVCRTGKYKYRSCKSTRWNIEVDDLLSIKEKIVFDANWSLKLKDILTDSNKADGKNDIERLHEILGADIKIRHDQVEDGV